MSLKPIFLWIALLLLLCGTVVSLQWLKCREAERKLAAARVELAEVQASVESVRTSVRKVQDRLLFLRAAEHTYKQLGDRLDAAAQKKSRLNRGMKALEAELDGIATNVSEAIETSRRRGVGMSFPRLESKTGKVLLEASIVEVRQDQLSFRHSLGHSKLSWQEVPDALANRFRMGPPPPPTREPAPSDSPALTGTPSVEFDSAPPPDPSGLKAVKDITARLDRLRGQIAQALEVRRQVANELYRVRVLHWEARWMGRISAHLVTADKLQQRLDAIDAQIVTARQLYMALQRDLALATARDGGPPAVQ